MSNLLELEDELHGFHPGSEGSAVTVVAFGETVSISTKFAVDPEDDEDGWAWGLGTTHLNVHGITELRDFLNAVLERLS